jgi:hypothetical protein
MDEVIVGLNEHLNTHKQAFLKSLSEHFNDQHTMVRLPSAPERRLADGPVSSHTTPGGAQRICVRTADQMHTVLYKVGKPSPSVVTKELEGPMTQLTHVYHRIPATKPLFPR